MRLARCPFLTRRPLTGSWFRAIRPQFFHTALSYSHTATIPGRFNSGMIQRPAFPILYLTSTVTVFSGEPITLLTG
jgi:RES domain-containing protein